MVDGTFRTIPTVGKLWSESFLFPPEPLWVILLMEYGDLLAMFFGSEVKGKNVLQAVDNYTWNMLDKKMLYGYRKGEGKLMRVIA